MGNRPIWIVYRPDAVPRIKFEAINALGLASFWPNIVGCEATSNRRLIFADCLLLLSQSVAAFVDRNHIFEKTHFSAWGG